MWGTVIKIKKTELPASVDFAREASNAKAEFPPEEQLDAVLLEELMEQQPLEVSEHPLLSEPEQLFDTGPAAAPCFILYIHCWQREERDREVYGLD